MKYVKKLFLIILVLTIFALPVLSFAQTTPDGPTLKEECGVTVDNAGDILCRIGFLLNKIIPILIGLGVIYFVWGVVTYMIGGDEEAKKKGKNKIIYGIIGLVVIFGLWGMVAIVVNTFNLDSQNMAGVSQSISNLTNVQSANAPFTCSLTNKPLLGDLIDYVTCIISKSVIPLIFVLAVAMFVWGVVQYVINADSEEKRSKGKQFMIWGIIALAVMLSVWGLVHILGDTFNMDYVVPQVQE